MFGKMEAMRPRILEPLKWAEVRIRPLAMRVSAHFGYTGAVSERPPGAGRKTMCFWAWRAEANPTGRVKKPLIDPVHDHEMQSMHRSLPTGLNGINDFSSHLKHHDFLIFRSCQIQSNASYLR